MTGSSDVLGSVRTARRRLLTESLGIAVSAGAFGFVFGLAAHDAGLSPLEAGAMSVIVFAAPRSSRPSGTWPWACRGWPSSS